MSFCIERMWIPMLSLTALPHVGGLFGGFITRKEVKTWYTTLNKPSWRPPNAAFPIAWTTLYTGMGFVQTLLTYYSLYLALMHLVALKEVVVRFKS